MAHFMLAGHGGNVTQLPYNEAIKHPIFKHYNPPVHAWSQGSLIPVTVPKLRVNLYPETGAENMPHPSGMDLAVRQQTQAQRDQMENDRQVYMHTLQREEELASLRQQVANANAIQQTSGDQPDDDDGDELEEQQRERRPLRRRPAIKKPVRRVVRFAQEDGSDESSGEDEIGQDGVEPVRNKKTKSGKPPISRSRNSRLAEQLSAAKSSKKKTSPY